MPYTGTGRLGGAAAAGGVRLWCGRSFFAAFYQDIVCVITGSRIERAIAKKKTDCNRFEYFRLVVTPGTSAYAIAGCGTSIMATQIQGMRELIHN